MNKNRGKGVSVDKSHEKYKIVGCINGKIKHLGRCADYNLAILTRRVWLASGKSIFDCELQRKTREVKEKYGYDVSDDVLFDHFAYFKNECFANFEE